MSSKHKMDFTYESKPHKPKPRAALSPAVPSTSTEADNTETGVVTPSKSQKEVSPIWYDVDVVKVSQYTVTNYSTKVDFPGDIVSNGLWPSHIKCAHAVFVCTTLNTAAFLWLIANTGFVLIFVLTISLDKAWTSCNCNSKCRHTTMQSL